jgi:hypothetical protein
MYVSLSGRSGSEANAQTLKTALHNILATLPDKRITLVTYSKGTADALEMLSTYPETAEWIDAMISVAGVVSGSPIADHFHDLYEMLLGEMPLLPCPPGDGLGVRSLSREVRLSRLHKNRMPQSIRYYSIAAIAPPGRVSSPLRVFNRMLNYIDPLNDGQVIFYDAIIPGSTLLGYLSADHWAVSLPFGRPNSPLRVFVDQNSFPREIVIEAIIRFVEQDRPR